MFNDTTPFAVMVVLWLLLLFSLTSWSVIFVKGWKLWCMQRHDRKFLSAFWQARDLKHGCDQAKGCLSPLTRLCTAAARTLHEFNRHSNDLGHTGERRDILERSLRQQVQKEQTAQESGLTLLASIGSISPFVGLFGTVWGIMHALRAIAGSGMTGLDVVAGPVGESLIATALGIATAIPAVLAYNFYLRRVRVSVTELENFAVDFLHLSLRHEHEGRE
jgi:biopolymer transport protein ExbB